MAHDSNALRVMLAFIAAVDFDAEVAKTAFVLASDARQREFGMLFEFATIVELFKQRRFSVLVSSIDEGHAHGSMVLRALEMQEDVLSSFRGGLFHSLARWLEQNDCSDPIATANFFRAAHRVLDVHGSIADGYHDDSWGQHARPLRFRLLDCPEAQLASALLVVALQHPMLAEGLEPRLPALQNRTFETTLETSQNVVSLVGPPAVRSLGLVYGVVAAHSALDLLEKEFLDRVTHRQFRFDILSVLLAAISEDFDGEGFSEEQHRLFKRQKREMARPDTQERTCSVCLEKVGPSREVYVWGCQPIEHAVHATCGERLRDVCPECRYSGESLEGEWEVGRKT